MPDFPGDSDGKESTSNVGDLGSILGLGRSAGGGHGNPLQYSCLENPMDRGAWRAKVHEVTKSDTTEQLSTARSTAVSYLPKHTILFKYIRDCSQMWENTVYKVNELGCSIPIFSWFTWFPSLPLTGPLFYSQSHHFPSICWLFTTCQSPCWALFLHRIIDLHSSVLFSIRLAQGHSTDQFWNTSYSNLIFGFLNPLPHILVRLVNNAVNRTHRLATDLQATGQELSRKWTHQVVLLLPPPPVILCSTSLPATSPSTWCQPLSPPPTPLFCILFHTADDWQNDKRNITS